MSSMMNPVGPEEPSVYWRRRAVVGVGLLLALWLLWWLFSSLFGSDSPDDQPVPPVQTSSASPTPTVTPTPSPVASAQSQPKAAAAARPTALAEARVAARKDPPRCGDSDVAVVVKPATRAGEVGTGMKVSMTVVNTGSAACRRDVAAAVNEIRVVSGRVLVWSSDFCARAGDGPKADRAVVTLKPAQAWVTTVRWPGRVTTPSCPATQRTAQAGTYRALGTNGGKRSAESVFTLS